MRIPILYQDSDIIVVDKPPGIPTHAPDPGDPYPGDALRIVQAQTGLPYLGMHQRLDADTSGVLLFAVRRQANRALAAAFEGRDVRKVYLALVHGAPPQAEGVIDAPIAREHGDRYRVTTPGDPHGLAARTWYRVVDTDSVLRSPYCVLRSPYSVAPQTQQPSPHQSRSTHYALRQSRTTHYAPRAAAPDEHSSAYTLLELIPATGRPHQIRVHLAHIGCPVVGDRLYGLADRPAPRLYLHAYRLTLPHPMTGQPVTFTAPAPEVLSGGGWGKDQSRRTDVSKAHHAANDTYGDEKQNADRAEIADNADRIGSHPRSPRRPRSPRPVLALGYAAHVRAMVRVPVALRALLRLAMERRAPLAADPRTDIYRLVNGAADGLPGLTADRCGGALVAAIYDNDDVVPPRPLPEALVEMLAETTGARAVYVKYRPKEAGRIPADQLPALAPPKPLYGPDLGEFVAHEEGLAYVIRPGEGLSTGLFPDMRESRARVAAWAAGRRVLNTFAYTCGFGVAATAGGATRVLNLDLSKSVLAWGQANYRANGFEPDPHDFVFGDVFDWLARLVKRGDRFDLVILDPPGFSRTTGRTFSAARDYGELVGLAARVTASGGAILACCNVAELPRRSFRDHVLAGCAAAGRAARVAGVYHEPAVDFPTLSGQEPYLKMLLLQMA